MAYLDEIHALLPDNGEAEISAEDIRTSFDIIDSNLGKLVKLDTGYKIQQDYTNFGTPGLNSVDISTQTNIDILNGTTGISSFCQGIGTRNANYTGVSLGYYNNNLPDTLLEIGNGTLNSRANVLEVYNTGLVTAPGLTLALINQNGNGTIATKEYVNQQNLNIQETDFTGNNVQEDFIITRVPVYIQVFNKGIKEQAGVNYTLANDGSETTITFITAPDTSAWVQIVTYG